MSVKKRVLVIRKPDKTVHIAELANKSRMQAYSNRLPEGQKWKFEEMNEEDALKLPMLDENYVTSVEAQQKVQSLTSLNAEQAAEIERLKALLDGKGARTPGAGNPDDNGAGNPNPAAPKKENVGVVVEKIKAATTVEEVNALADGDERVGVTKAAEEKIEELNQQ